MCPSAGRFIQSLFYKDFGQTRRSLRRSGHLAGPDIVVVVLLRAHRCLLKGFLDPEIAQRPVHGMASPFVLYAHFIYEHFAFTGF